MDNPNQLFPVDKVPLPVSTCTVRRYIESGTLGHVRIGGRIFVSADQIQAFISAGRHDSAPQQ